MRDFRDAKAMAKALKQHLAETNIEISHTRALELVARQLGFASWNVLSAKIDAAATGGVRFDRVAPIIRIFDLAKAREFYLDFLGFTVDWEHRYGDNFPIYMQISRAGLTLHLSEHAGDATPGSNCCVYTSNLAAYQAELIGKQYRYMRPGLEKTDGRVEMEVIDPFNNHIRFMELID